MAAVETFDPSRSLSSEVGGELDALHRRAVAEDLLVVRHPTTGLYSISDGRSFRATPVVLEPEALAQRRARYALAGQGG